MEQDIERMVDLPLSKEELLLLERQDKQLNVIIEEIKTIKANHYTTTILYKKRLQLKNSAKKVVNALKNQTTNQLMGSDMSRLINAINSKDLFSNNESVSNAIKQRNDVINQTITKLNTLLNEYRFRE